MNARPRLLDLFCGAGGAAMGYYRAGFDVVGVDISYQRNYPFEFWHEDALTMLSGGTSCYRAGESFNAIHASPPCQAYSAMTNCRPGLSNDYPDLIGPVRELLIDAGLPYVIENVPGAPLKDPARLCGQMFGLELYRHRLFETNWDFVAPAHPEHTVPTSRAGHWVPGTVMSVSGHVAPIAKAREVMGIDWTTREELAEAVPPAYTEFIGERLMEVVQSRALVPDP